VAELLPAAALSSALGAALSSPVSVPAKPWLVLAAWAVIAPLVAARVFRWE
jgi:hypothetical protein